LKNYGCDTQDPSDPGRWGLIHTEGWFDESVGGVSKAKCTLSSSSVNNKEVTTEQYRLIKWFWAGFQGEYEIDFQIPKGAKLKVCLTQKDNYNNPNSDRYLCDYTDRNVIFENVIYEMANFSTVTQTLNETADFSVYPFMLDAGNRLVNVYFILEFDPNTYSNDEFVLNTFDVRLKNITAPHTILFSSTVDDRFFLSAQGIGGTNTFTGEYGNVFRTMDNGTNFLELTNSSLLTNIIGGFGAAKRLFLASPNDPFTYYMGATGHYPAKSIGNLAGVQTWSSINPNGSNGLNSHDDYRSAKIYDIGGEDYIVAGNDGGICEIIQGQFVQMLNSLNGDIVLNMIYNLDIHEKTGTVLMGLQDNGTRYFQEGLNNVTPASLSNGQGWGGDGCVTFMKREVGDPGAHAAVAGDPQDDGTDALRDIQEGNWPSPPQKIVNPNPPINGGEPYLGMRLEEYKLSEDRFITGLEGGHIIVNRGALVTEKEDVPGAGRIGAIAICQNDSKFAYVADGKPKGLNEKKLFKTDNDAYDWIPVDAILHFPNHPTQPGLMLNLTSQIEGKFINALGVDHDNPNLVYIGMSGIGEINGVVTNEYFRVLKSDPDYENNETFNDWSEGLPALPVNYLLPIESEKHIIFCATDAGVYYRMDGMHQWECFSNNLAKTRITDLSYNYCSRELYASTYGRGVWKTPVNLDTYSTYAEEITGNEFWNTDRDVRSNVRVKNGATLTISSTVHVDADRKFIVEPGAKLIIDNGTITNACGQYWKGIEVMGDYTHPQDPLLQGHLITQNGAKIEYAKEAIATWELGNYASTGGIVHCTNTQFVNNRTSAYFYPYQDIDGNGIETLNTSFFTNCEFLWDDNYIDQHPMVGVILNNVNGVTIKGSDFIDSRTNLTGGDSRPKGIFSLDAGYKVLARNTTLGALPTHEVFSTAGGYDVNNFENLEYGIYSLGANSTRTITADHCKFENVAHGINLSAVDNAVLTRNLVDYNASHPTDIGTSQGIEISEATGYTIQGNTFNNYDAEAFVNACWHLTQEVKIT
jgi:hypothetical protein